MQLRVLKYTDEENCDAQNELFTMLEESYKYRLYERMAKLSKDLDLIVPPPRRIVNNARFGEGEIVVPSARRPKKVAREPSVLGEEKADNKERSTCRGCT